MSLTPPQAAQRAYSYTRHGVTIDDPWHWLRDSGYPNVTDPDVLDYLKAENAYFDAWRGGHEPLIDQLFAEMKGRIKEDDRSVPVRDGDFLYWWAFTPGAQYRQWFRRLSVRPERSEPQASAVEGRSAPDKKDRPSTSLRTNETDDAPTELLFDEPAAADGKDYFRLGALEVSPDGKLLATLIDDDGSERFRLRIRDLATGKDLETVTEVGIGQPVWTSDSGGVVFTEVNDKWRSYRARYHRLGDAPDQAITLYEEIEDPGFSVGVG